MTRGTRIPAVLGALAMLAGACGGSGDGSSTASKATSAATGGAGATTAASAVVATTTKGTTSGGSAASTTSGGAGDDLKALGLWNDGPCDAARDPLVIGNISPHESPVLSLIDHVRALEAAAAAFNARGGANGHCIKVVACDDQNTFDAAVACVKKLDGAGVVATVNDSGTVAQGEVAAGLAKAGVPRVGGNVAPADWGDQNAYPVSASSTATVLLLPGALVQQGITKIAVARVDLPEAGAAVSLFDSVYGHSGASFPADLSVPAGTTDYSQFVLAAQNAGAKGIAILLGEQEAVQVVRAGRQLASDLQVAASLGSFSYNDISNLGEAAAQMTFVWGFPPATADLPVYEVVRADLASTGEKALTTENLKAGSLQSWVSLYALLRVLHDAGVTELTRAKVTAALNAATDVPMLGIFGDATWTPSHNYGGQYKRVGVDRLTYWTWDPKKSWNGHAGNFVQGGDLIFSKIMCGSLLGSPAPC